MSLRWLSALLLISALGHTLAGQEASPTKAGADDPQLKSRPAQRAPTAPKARRMQLDAVVTDAWGKPVTGLQPWDFKLLDNDHSSKILYFRAFDNQGVKAQPPVEVILLLDALNLNVQQQGFVRNELTRYLQQNKGQLAHPTTLMVLGDNGVAVQPQPSLDGNALAALLKTVNPHITAFAPTMGIQGAIERFNRSVQQMRLIAENETHKPGRKLLIWISAGWPLLEREQNFLPAESNNKKYFEDIVELSGWLREARMVVYSAAPIDPSMGAAARAPLLYQDFVKPVSDARQAQSGNLGLRVLALHTGGQILGPSNDVAGQINQCIADADSFYQLTFEPAPAEHADEYHSLKLSVVQPGLTVRTDTGYYDQPNPQ
ncbi:VWA domain-containing protein [Occallatibacter riparius]|uniref:VWA domain-containing protein n=1 Tax=Occallatibacter riparius TaxID=1002689 RepID=A0A9J7BT20_9BACT|nr:VWA domain-containing protein [Occallatibacter riparius]UWZ85729.1 VWA domain-containing protein [Occallatibacter riparius]